MEIYNNRLSLRHKEKNLGREVVAVVTLNWERPMLLQDLAPLHVSA